MPQKSKFEHTESRIVIASFGDTVKKKKTPSKCDSSTGRKLKENTPIAQRIASKQSPKKSPKTKLSKSKDSPNIKLNKEQKSPKEKKAPKIKPTKEQKSPKTKHIKEKKSPNVKSHKEKKAPKTKLVKGKYIRKNKKFKSSKAKKKIPKKRIIVSDDEYYSSSKGNKKRKTGKRGRRRIERVCFIDKSVERRVSPQKSGKKKGNKFSVIGNWYIASGYLNDIISLLDDFEAQQGWRFIDFAHSWQKKKFSQVYRGRQTFKELLEFSEEIALLTQRFLRPPHSTKRRVGALYTLYGLYFKHPTGHFFHIRMELQDYKETLDLIHPFRSNPDNPDPAYIFKKMELQGAILHCANSLEFCYDFQNEERKTVDLEYGKQRLAKASTVDVAIPKIQLATDSALFDCYSQVKAKLSGSENQPEKSLIMLQSKFVSDVGSILQELKAETIESLEMLPTASQEVSDAAEDSAAADEPLQIPNFMEIQSRVFKDECTSLYSGENRASIYNDPFINDFMKPPSSKELQRPLQESHPGTLQEKSQSKLPQLDLTDVKAKKCNVGQYSDATKEDPLTIPSAARSKRTKPSRTQALIKGITRPVKQVLNPKVEEYKPYICKYLEDELNSENRSINTVKPVTNKSSTNVLASELLTISDPDGFEANNEIPMKARLSSGKLIRIKKLKVKVSWNHWKQIVEDPARYEQFKQKVMPLLVSEDESHRNWTLMELVPLVAPPGELVKEEAHFDEDEVPIENEKTDPLWSDLLHDDELINQKEQVDEPYEYSDGSSSNASDDEFYASPEGPKRKYNKKGKVNNYRKILRDDSIISGATQTCKRKMKFIKIGNRMQCIFDVSEEQSDANDYEKENFYSWNDFSSDKPPVCLKRKRDQKPFTIMYSNNKRTKPPDVDEPVEKESPSPSKSPCYKKRKIAPSDTPQSVDSIKKETVSTLEDLANDWDEEESPSHINDDDDNDLSENFEYNDTLWNEPSSLQALIANPKTLPERDETYAFKTEGPAPSSVQEVEMEGIDEPAVLDSLYEDAPENGVQAASETFPTINIDSVGKPIYCLMKDHLGNDVFVPIDAILPTLPGQRNESFDELVETDIRSSIVTAPPSIFPSLIESASFTSPEKKPMIVPSPEKKPATVSISEKKPATVSQHNSIDFDSSTKPSCSFFFSPKFKPLGRLHSSAGIASGKPPVVANQPPVVKFLRKGSFGGKKKARR